MIGVIVPAHDEEEVIEDCVQSLLKASTHPDLAREVVQIIFGHGLLRCLPLSLAHAPLSRCPKSSDGP